MNANLNGQQFGGAPSLGVAAAGVPEPRQAPEESHPLSLSSQTAGSVAQSAAWRKPTTKNRVLPYSEGTRGTLFKPQPMD